MIFYNASLDPKQEIKLEKNTENELLFVFGAHGGKKVCEVELNYTQNNIILKVT